MLGIELLPRIQMARCFKLERESGGFDYLQSFVSLIAPETVRRPVATVYASGNKIVTKI